MIKINQLQKNFKDFSLNVSLSIAPGTVTGLIGKNGAGKSTTIKLILGLLRPSSGEIKVFGKSPCDFTVEDRENIGVALSDSGFSTMFNILDILKIMRNMYKQFDEKFFVDNCKEQELPFDKQIKDFSTGMKAKLRVLTALSHNAKLLILDEPTAGLDVIARNEVLDILRNYLAQDTERSMLISSHISSDLEGMCDDIYMIDKGAILLHEDTDTILGQYAVLKISDTEYNQLDKQYLIAIKKESFGYSCLTNEKQFYIDNYPNIILENGNIDQMILIMLGGNKL